MDAESTRAQQHGQWSGVAAGWGAYRDLLGDMTRPVTDQMLELLQPRPGEHLLDLASGTGNPAFSLAERVLPNGSVLGLDLTASMLAAARARARELGIQNIEFRTIADETDLGVPPGAFDGATCRFGLMFMPDPVGAMKAVRAALRAEGRVVVATWGPDERNPLAVFRREIAERHVSLRVSGPSWITVSSFDGLEGVLAEAGFEELQTAAVEVIAASAGSAEEFWEQQSDISVAQRGLLASLSEEKQAAVRADTIAALEAMFPDGPIRFHGEALVCMGVNPGDD